MHDAPHQPRPTPLAPPAPEPGPAAGVSSAFTPGHPHAPVPDADALRDVFRERGLRFTKQRDLVYRALATTTAHPTAEELHQLVCTEDSSLSLATVYNTLEAMTEAGLARRIPSSSGSGPSRYDADMTDHVHVAYPDGRVVDVPGDVSRALLGQLDAATRADLERRLGVSIAEITVAIRAR